MTPPTLLLAAFALIPAMATPADGAPPQSVAGALMIALCGGGSMAISFGGGAPQPAGAPCCCAKGCRTGDKRNRIDRKQ